MILAGGHAGAGGAGPLPRRGRGGRPAAAPQHRADLRGRRARRPALLLAGIRRRRQPGPSALTARPCRRRQAARAGRDAGAGHARRPRSTGIVHRDLKPANVLLSRPDGTPKITDFGLAKQLGRRPGQTPDRRHHGHAQLHGPRAGRGARASAIGPAADVYALGAILYELLTGRPPFRAATAAGHAGAGAAPRSRCRRRRLQPKVPRDLETICLKCLQKEPAQALRQRRGPGRRPAPLPAGEPILARPVDVLERAVKWCAGGHTARWPRSAW